MARTLTLAGVDFMPQYKTNSSKIREILQNKSNVFDFVLTVKAGQTLPSQGAEVVFKDGARYLFGGYITKLDPTETGKGALLEYQMEASDYSYMFNNKIVRRAYTNQTLLYIVTDIINTYLGSSYGFDLSNVATGPVIPSIQFDHISIRACFENLANTTGYIWWTDYQKKLYFQSIYTSPAPEAIRDSASNISSLSISYDTSQIRNSVIVVGSDNGEQSLSTISETFVGDGVTRSWQLSAKPSQVQSITINGVSKQFSLDLNERSTDIFVYSFDAQSFRVTTSQNPPANGTDTVVITYYPRIDIIVTKQDLPSITFFKNLDGGTGVYEYTIQDQSITSKAQALARATQELASFSTALVTGVFTTRTGLLTPGSYFQIGQLLTVNSPIYGINSDATFVIQEVNTVLSENAGTLEYIYTVRFGGKLVGVREFLESLAPDSQQTQTTVAVIKTIQTTADAMTQDDTTHPVTMTKATPPFHYTSGAPVGRWNESEWS